MEGQGDQNTQRMMKEITIMLDAYLSNEMNAYEKANPLMKNSDSMMLRTILAFDHLTNEIEKCDKMLKSNADPHLATKIVNHQDMLMSARCRIADVLNTDAKLRN